MFAMNLRPGLTIPILASLVFAGILFYYKNRPTSLPTGNDRNHPTPIVKKLTRSKNSPAAKWLREVKGRFRDEQLWKGFGSDSLTAFTEGIRSLGNEHETFIAAGNRALGFGKNETAIACFYRAAELDSDNPDALKGLSVALLADRRYEDALPIFEMLVGISPDDRTARFNLAVIQSRLGYFGQAEQNYLELLRQDEDFLEARYNLATLYQSRGKLMMARDTWRKVLSKAPDFSKARESLGEVLTDLGDTDGAMAEYSEAAKLQDDDPTAWLNFASAAKNAGSLGRAVVAAKKAIKLAPRDKEIWARYGNLLLDVHRVNQKREFLEEALQAWQMSLEIDPQQENIIEKVEMYRRVLLVTSQQAPEN